MQSRSKLTYTLVVIVGFRVLTLSVALSCPGTEVPAVQILRFADDGLWGKLSALGIAMILITTALVLLATLVGARFKAVDGG
jgi:iron(III) transport system permease protein